MFSTYSYMDWNRYIYRATGQQEKKEEKKTMKKTKEIICTRCGAVIDLGIGTAEDAKFRGNYVCDDCMLELGEDEETSLYVS